MRNDDAPSRPARQRPPRPSSVEEQQLARLLTEEIGKLGKNPRQVARELREGAFDGFDGQPPGQATVYRYLRGANLIDNGDYLADYIISLVHPAERRAELGRKVQALVQRHRENPTPLPPEIPDDSTERIEALERDLTQAEADKDTAIQAAADAADEKIGAIRRLLEVEMSRRATAEQAVVGLTPPDPAEEAHAMAEDLIAASAGNSAELDTLLYEYSDNEISAETHAALLLYLQERASRNDLAVKMATVIGEVKYYRLIPAILKVLGGTGGPAWIALCESIGVRYWGDHRRWLLQEMQDTAFSGVKGNMVNGIARNSGAVGWQRFANELPMFGLDQDYFTEMTAAYRPLEALLDLIDALPDAESLQLLRSVGENRKAKELISIIDALRARGEVGNRQANAIWHAAAQNRAPSATAELMTTLYKADRTAEASSYSARLRGDATDYLSLDVGKKIVALREAGLAADADSLGTSLTRKAEPSTFRYAVKQLRSNSADAEADRILLEASRRWWYRRWKLGHELSEEDMQDDVERMKARSLVSGFSLIGWLALGGFFVAFFGLLVFYMLLRVTPLGSGAYIGQVLAGDRPVTCDDRSGATCDGHFTLTYTIAPGSTVRTAYKIDGKLHYLTTALRVTLTNGCSNSSSRISYTLTAGSHRKTGQIAGADRKDVMLNTGGSDQLALRIQTLRSTPGCAPIFTLINPKVNRFSQWWLHSPQ